MCRDLLFAANEVRSALEDYDEARAGGAGRESRRSLRSRRGRRGSRPAVAPHRREADAPREGERRAARLHSWRAARFPAALRARVGAGCRTSGGPRFDARRAERGRADRIRPDAPATRLAHQLPRRRRANRDPARIRTHAPAPHGGAERPESGSLCAPWRPSCGALRIWPLSRCSVPARRWPTLSAQASWATTCSPRLGARRSQRRLDPLRPTETTTPGSRPWGVKSRVRSRWPSPSDSTPYGVA